jgi:V8-like Glu-specific endopeptidase
MSLQKQLEQTPMDDPKRPAIEKQLGAAGGRKIYDDNKTALFMLVAHQNNRVSGFCTAFAVKPRLLASNAHCAKASADLVAKGATIWAHLNESTKTRQPKMYRISRFAGHPRYQDNKKELSPDVGLFELADEDAPKAVKTASKIELQGLGTGDDLFVIGFPGRVMDELSPVATFMFSHVGRVTDSKGEEATKFEDAWLIQHEGMTTPGTSGSPIFNGAGDVVAINAGGLLEANSNDAVYKYAMRIDLLDDVKLGAKNNGN